MQILFDYVLNCGMKSPLQTCIYFKFPKIQLLIVVYWRLKYGVHKPSTIFGFGKTYKINLKFCNNKNANYSKNTFPRSVTNHVWYHQNISHIKNVFASALQRCSKFCIFFKIFFVAAYMCEVTMWDRLRQTKAVYKCYRKDEGFRARGHFRVYEPATDARRNDPPGRLTIFLIFFFFDKIFYLL